MMMNLFSMFDPGSSLMSLAWVLFFMTPLVFPKRLWYTTSIFLKLLKKLLLIFKKEVHFSLKKSEKGTESLIILVFLSILLLNFLALYPQVFSITSHLTFNLPLSFTFWLSLMFFGWSNNTNHMMVHLVPQGTPTLLMSFMVLIEMVSNLIRPITLCVRLTANLIAGHLLMSLLGNFLLSMNLSFSIFLLFMPLLLTVLESAVACIQAYVFMTLVTLYTTEVKYE